MAATASTGGGSIWVAAGSALLSTLFGGIFNNSAAKDQASAMVQVAQYNYKGKLIDYESDYQLRGVLIILLVIVMISVLLIIFLKKVK